MRSQVCAFKLMRGFGTAALPPFDVHKLYAHLLRLRRGSGRFCATSNLALGVLELSHVGIPP